MRRKGWSDLAPDLLRDIAGRLHVAADLVIFHAVCHPWRSSRDQPSGKTTTTTQLLPWFLAPTEKHGQSSPLKLRCIFSKSSYSALPRPYPRQRDWVHGTDGATDGYLTVNRLRPTLHDPITRAVTDLPRFPYYFDYPWEENPFGIVYGDGTIFVYGISRDGSERGSERTARFRAALLRPGDTKWTVVDRTYETNGKLIEFCAWTVAGRFLISMESSRWRIVTPDDGDDEDDVLVSIPRVAPNQPGSPSQGSSYILETQGELLWVQVKLYYSDHPGPCSKTFSVSVHALEEATVPEKARWVEKGGHCLADRVLFLGSPNSFTADASLLGGQGGGAYFAYQDSMAGVPKKFGMFRYSFLDGKTECIQRLPEEWHDKKCTWFIPQPTVAPVQQIIRRKRQAEKLKKHQKAAPITSPSRIFQIERHYEQRCSVLVHDLPPKVKNSQLQLFFGEHGKVLSTEVIYSKDAKTSEGIVKMATMHAHEEDALAALDGLDFQGCSLEVVLANDKQRQRWRWRNAA